MKTAKLFLISIALICVSCSSSKSVTYPTSKLVLTIDNPDTVKYLKEKYPELTFIEKVKSSDNLYIYQFTGPRSQLIQVKQNLIGEEGVSDVSNYAASY